MCINNHGMQHGNTLGDLFREIPFKTNISFYRIDENAQHWGMLGGIVARTIASRMKSQLLLPLTSEQGKMMNIEHTVDKMLSSVVRNQMNRPMYQCRRTIHLCV